MKLRELDKVDLELAASQRFIYIRFSLLETIHGSCQHI